MREARTPGQRAGLTRVAVLDAARTLLAEAGLDGLSMRALATRLGVAPNALYSHVANKTALVDDLLDDTLADVPEPVDAARPRDALLEVMTATYDVLLAHPDLVPLYLARQGARGPNARRLGDAMLVELARGGVHGEAAAEAVRVLIVHTIGFAALATAASAPVAAAELRGNLVSGLGWLLSGVLDNRTGPPTE